MDHFPFAPAFERETGRQVKARFDESLARTHELIRDRKLNVRNSKGSFIAEISRETFESRMGDGDSGFG